MDSKKNTQKKYAKYAGLILGVVFLLFSLVFFILVLLDRKDQSIDHTNLQISNIGKNSFTVTWTSDEAYIGEIYCIEESESSKLTSFLSRVLQPSFNTKIYSDDRDKSFSNLKEVPLPKKRYTHYVTIDNLKSQTNYKLKLAGLVSAVDLADEIGVVKTLENEVGLIPEPAYGYIENISPDGDSYVLINNQASRILSEKSTYAFNLNELGDTLQNEEINLQIFNKNIQKTAKLKTGKHKPLANIDFSRAIQVSHENHDNDEYYSNDTQVLGAEVRSISDSNPDSYPTTQDLQESSLSAFYEEKQKETNSSEQAAEPGTPPESSSPTNQNKIIVNNIPTYQVAIKPTDLANLEKLAEEPPSSNSPQVAGESDSKGDDEPQIEVDESGRYSFFEGCERVGEVDVVINPGQNKAYLKLFSDDNGNNIKDGQEEYLKDIRSLDFSKEASAVDYELSTGWNLINLPLIDARDEPGRIGTANELIEKWGEQGAQIKSAAEFKAGRFNILTKRESGTDYGNDFELIPGDGIFVFNIGPNAEVTFSGNKFTSSVPISLSQGWNLKGILSIDKKFSSDSLLSDINSQGIGANMVSSFENGIYTTVVSEENQIYGNNFPIIEKYGYFINVESDGGKNYIPGSIIKEEERQGYSQAELEALLEQNQQYIPENCAEPIEQPGPDEGDDNTGDDNIDSRQPGDPSPPSQTCNNTFASQCRKVGENFAVNGAGSNDAINRANNLNMGYTLAIATDPQELDGIANSFNYIISKGMKPILRICTAGGHCGFTDPNTYTNFVKSLSDKVANREFLVITGANEPLTETWAGNQEGDPVSTARATTQYMNAVINSLKGYDNLTLLSPAFNLTNPYFEELITEMKNQGANFSELDAISGNAYNFADGNKISGFVDRTDRVFSGIGIDKPIVLTEVGMFDNNRNVIFSAGGGTPHEQAMLNLKSELDKLKVDSRIMAILLFDTFATNGSETFDYNFMSDQEHKIVLTPECVSARC
jgi:hypothetical protein